MRTVMTPASVLRRLSTPLPTVTEVAQDDELRWQAAAEVLLASGDFRRLKSLCDVMLAHRPNHLDALYYRARLAMARGDHAAALPPLERVLKSDPEAWAARYAYGILLLRNDATAMQGMARCSEAVSMGGVVAGQVAASLPKALVTTTLHNRPALQQQQWEQAYQSVKDAFPLDLRATYTDLPRELLVSLLMLEALGAGGALGSGRRLAHKTANDSPALVKPRLLLAEWYTAEGDIGLGMNYLHDAKALDPGGRVARRLGLPMLTVAYSTPLPSAVPDSLAQLPDDVRHAAAVVQGWQAPVPFDSTLTAKSLTARRFGTGQSTLRTRSPVVESIQSDLLKIQQRLNRPKVTESATCPAELVITARQPFVKLYGAAAAEEILTEVAALVAAKNSTPHLRAYLVVLDDVPSVKTWGLDSIQPHHAASVKRVLDHIDSTMETRGEQVGSVLIVGGDAVVPFHHLPNPVDDHDADVPSDNPYGATGDRYLLPTRAVGRLPHDRTSPALLLNQLRRLQVAWQESIPPTKANWMGKRIVQKPRLTKGAGWGYAAEVWGAAAKEVYKVLDSHNALHLCPPAQESDWRKEPIPTLPYYYFNLHGVADNGNYYGQAADLRLAQSELYPTALTPAQFAALTLEKAVIFSEACYGANHKADVPAQSLALTALQQGATLFVGSTNTSYASFKPPLMAADLLAALFWQAIGDGLPGGAALQRAKTELAERIQERGGFVDVEEQKALLSFVLYGDPALPLTHRPRHPDTSGLRRNAKKTMDSSRYQVAAKTIPNQNLDPTLRNAVLAYVAPYTQAAVATPKILARPLSTTDAPPSLSPYFTPTAALAKSSQNGRSSPAKERWHVTVSQPYSKDGVLHQKVITLTMDDKGKVVKSHTSR